MAWNENEIGEDTGITAIRCWTCGMGGGEKNDGDRDRERPEADMWILSDQFVGDILMSRVGGHLSWNARKWYSR